MTSSSRVAHLIDNVLEATVVASFSKVGYAVRSRVEEWPDPPDVAGRTMVITGATSGLGLAMAQRLAGLGADVHLVGRNQTRIDEAVDVVTRGARGSVQGHRCDLSLLSDTGALADELTSSCGPIDVLVHNAGALTRQYTPTAEGVETTLATHLLSPYYLTEQLIAASGFADRARVITMTSGGMYTERFDLATLEMTANHYRGTVAYARAKRAQSVLVTHWQQTMGARGLAFHLVHPGWSATPGVTDGLPGFSRVMRPLLRTPAQGADTTVWLAGLAPGQPEAGRLWLDRHPRSLHRLRRTRLSPAEEAIAQQQLPAWCAARVARALAQDV